MPITILAIETSCDETSVAVVTAGNNGHCSLLSNVISSQVDFHRKYGGIVPEVASRHHVEAINPAIKEALEKAGIGFGDLSAVAVTYGPGLVGSLLVGLSAAKAIAYAHDIPLIGTNHIEGHIYANFVDETPIQFPFLCLIVSGGHTQLVVVEDHGKYKTVGTTKDDAAGEAFDKVARFLGLGYPGGPIIDKIAQTTEKDAIKFPRAMLNQEGYDFSFSGIKTAVVNHVKKKIKETVGLEKGKAIRSISQIPNFTLPEKELHQIAASFQEAVVDTLVEKTMRAAKELKINTIAFGGGVCANSRLKEKMQIAVETYGCMSLHYPPVILCTDNAAMIGALGFYKYQKKEFSPLDLVPVANLRI